MNTFKKCLAEAIGTFVLVFFACGVAALTKGELVATALAFGLVIVAMAYTIGNISGCHINPAVSLAMAIKKEITWKEFGLYCLSQVIGGLIGGIVLFAILNPLSGGDIGDACNGVISGSVDVGTVFASLGAEIILTCIFVYVIICVTSKNGAGKAAGAIIGATLTLVHLVGIGLTGTSVNPARSIATAVSAWIFNGTTVALEQIWIFIVGPLLGALLAVLLYKALHGKAEEAETTEE